ncbi:MAG: IclR family transcriptional regulator [Planctomycetota bacterium]
MARSAERTLDVLEYLGRAATPVSAAALSGGLRIPRATLFRLLKDLIRRGYVSRDMGNGAYTLGLRVLPLAAAVLNRMDIREASYDPMHKLLAESQETVELLVPHEDEMIFVEKMDSPQSMRIFARVGSTIPLLHLMAHGKVMLAFMPEEQRRAYLTRPMRRDAKGAPVKRARLETELRRVQRRHWAVDHQEARLEVTRFSAPVFDHLGKFTGAVGFAGPTIRLPRRRQKEFARMVLVAARSITANLGGTYPV